MPPKLIKIGASLGLALPVVFVFDVLLAQFSRTLGIALTAIEVFLAVALFQATRFQFEARGFRTAGTPLAACSALVIAFGLVIVIGEISFDAFRKGAIGFGSFWPIAMQVCLIALAICLCWFADKCHEYAKLPGGIWKAVAITYQVASFALVIMLVSLFFPSARLQGSLSLSGLSAR